MKLTRRTSLAALALAPLVDFSRPRPSAAQGGQPFHETGKLMPGAGFVAQRNMYPTVATLPDGRLLLVWTSVDKIVGSWSRDHGKTWSAEETLIAIPEHTNGDPTIIVTPTTVQVHSTTTPRPRKPVLSSDVYVTEQPLAGGAWSSPRKLPSMRQYLVGMIHAGFSMPDGTLIKPYAWDVFAEEGKKFEGEGKMYLRSGALRSTDGGKTWSAGADMAADPPKTTAFGTGGVCEPSMVLLPSGEIYCLLRTADTKHWESRSRDGGKTWDTPKPSPLVGHNTPSALCRLRETNEVVVVWNNSPQVRWPLDTALSADGCKSWSTARTLANPMTVQASYPSVTQAADGTIVAVWQQDWPDRKGRDLMIARYNRAWLKAAG